MPTSLVLWPLMISKATIDEIKNQMDIVDVVGDFVTLKKSGSSYKALSPFSAEKTPSFYVVPSKQIFKDFSSGKGGDAITFIMEIDGLSYMEALRYLAKKYGIEVKEEERTDLQQEEQNKRESLYILLNYAKEYFCDKLLNSEEGRNIGLTYFKERGFSDETVKKFELGYSLDEWTGLMDTLVAKGYTPELLEEAGLVVKGENRTYDRFRARVMFPIHNVTGKTIAFGARTLSKEKNQPKYINSPETELYHKSKVLYGLFQSKLAIRKEDNVFLVEGYTDVISMHQAGLENVVSSSGTALTLEQVKLLKRYTNNVTVLFDGDAAGIRAAIRGIDLLLEGDLDVKAVVLPDGEDPDSYSRKLSVSAFRNYVEAEAKDIIQFKVKLFLEEAGHDPIKKSAVIREIVSSISKINDPVKRAVYIKECSTIMELSEQVLISELNKILFDKSRESKAAYEPVAEAQYLIEQEKDFDFETDEEKKARHERDSLLLLILYGTEVIAEDGSERTVAEYIFDEFNDEINFGNPLHNQILDKIRDFVDNKTKWDAKLLMELSDSKAAEEIVSLLVVPREVSENWNTKHKIYVPKNTDNLMKRSFWNVLRLKIRLLRPIIQAEREKLKNLVETREVDRVLDEIIQLKNIEMAIAAGLGNVTIE